MTINIQDDQSLIERIKSVQRTGAFKILTEVDFIVYLLELGFMKYEKCILPLELQGEGGDG